MKLLSSNRKEVSVAILKLLGTAYDGSSIISDRHQENETDSPDDFSNLMSHSFFTDFCIMNLISHLDTPSMPLFEAIAQAGGLAVNARVDKVAVIRNVGNDAEMYVADLRTKDVFTSPCYYLQQNDVIYVEPRYIKRDAEDRGWQIGTTLLSVVTAVCSFLWAGSALGWFQNGNN